MICHPIRFYNFLECMKKEIVMRRILILLGSLLLLFLAMGCGGAETAVPAQPDTATDGESEVQTVAGKPQLIEFYADW